MCALNVPAAEPVLVNKNYSFPVSNTGQRGAALDVPPVWSCSCYWASLVTYSALLTEAPPWGKPSSALPMHTQENQTSPTFCPSFLGKLQSELVYWHTTKPSNPSLPQDVLSHSCSSDILTTNLTECSCAESPTKAVPKLKDMPLPSGKSQTSSDGNKPVATYHPHPSHGGFWVGAGAEHCLVITKMDFRHYSHIHTSQSVVYLLAATSSDSVSASNGPNYKSNNPLYWNDAFHQYSCTWLGN